MKHIEFNLEITNYPMYHQFKKFLRFYEELEYCSKEMKKLIDIVHILNNTKNLDLVCHRNYEIISLNFNFMYGLLNLFKFDQKNVIENILLKIYFINLYFFLKEEFSRLRKKYKSYYYFCEDEESRYIESLIVLFKEKKENILNDKDPIINLFPSKIGYLFLRQIHYYIFKINKYLFKSHSEDHFHKLTYYVKYIITQTVLILECKIQFPMCASN